MCGSMNETNLNSRDFSVSKFDEHLYFKCDKNGEVIILLVVDDMTLLLNRQELFDDLKRHLQNFSGVKLHAELTILIDWSIIHERQGFTIY